MTAEYDDMNLYRLFEELQPNRRLQALKGGFRNAAAAVRKAAVANLRASGIRTDRDLEGGVRSMVFKRKAGFRVTVGTKGDKGFHTNRQGLRKPILLWAETGTAERRTKNGGGNRAARSRASHGTGRMPRYAFMERTLGQVSGSVTNDIHTFVEQNIYRIAKKYGCH